VLHPISQRLPERAPIATEPAVSAISKKEHILSQKPMMGVETILGFSSMRLPRTRRPWKEKEQGHMEGYQ
jgi:hypothetical protein